MEQTQDPPNTDLLHEIKRRLVAWILIDAPHNKQLNKYKQNGKSQKVPSLVVIPIQANMSTEFMLCFLTPLYCYSLVLPATPFFIPVEGK